MGKERRGTMEPLLALPSFLGSELYLEKSLQDE